jgi:hypothetical protein
LKVLVHSKKKNKKNTKLKTITESLEKMIDPVETLISEISGLGSIVDVNVAIASRKREQTVVAEIK